MLKEFKNFIMTGNVIDFAVAVIMAGAIGLVINGFVGDIIMPIVGHFAGGVDFAELGHELQAAVMNGDEVSKEAIVLKYGAFIQSCIDFRSHIDAYCECLCC